MCKVFNVSRSGFYSWNIRKPGKRLSENEVLTKEILSIFKESHSTYGSPRIARELSNRMMYASRPRVARLMKKRGIVSKIGKKFIATTDSKHNYLIMDNLLNRNFNVEKTGKKWVSDITYISTGQGWLYLTMIMDLADRKIIGWSLSETMKAMDTVIPAWKMAAKNRAITEELIFHSDQGVQYACTEFANLLKSNKKVLRSMSRKGNCWDNAVAESFFKTLKTEIIYGNKFTTRKEAALSIFYYIETWYNRKRLHSTLGYMSPENFKNYLNLKNIAA